jgi:hypothetical protein
MLFSKRQSHFFSENFHKEVKGLIMESRGLMLPNFQNSSTFHLIMSREISNMNKKIQELLVECKNYILDIFIYLIKLSFSTYPSLANAIVAEIKNSVNDQVTEVRKLVMELIKSEMEGEWTSNTYYMDLISKITNKISEKREYYEKNQGKTIFTINSNTGNIDSKVINPNFEFNDVILKENEFFPSNVIISHDNNVLTVRNIQISCFAYWKIFEKRFVDTYQNIISMKLVHFYVKGLGLMLEKKFSPSVCKTDFITEEVSITKKRKDIEDGLNRLNHANQEISMIL